jgi:DNA polymerase-3 subunit epsilon
VRVTGEARVRILLPRVLPDAAHLQEQNLRATDVRPEYYDFNLFERAFEDVDLQRPLSSLMYTVFDTETTGLEPLNDEIIQVGAVRILNGRILNQEYFDELIDPRIPLKAASIAIHGITDSMLLGKPTSDLVLPAFQKFCADTVLVGHNVAFDMRFLSIKERQIGVRFDHPVLDTLMLSAVATPNQASHSLEAIMDRLGVRMDKRHNALADATATAEVFLKLLPLLAEQGVTTLGQAIEASQKTYYAKIKY